MPKISLFFLFKFNKVLHVVTQFSVVICWNLWMVLHVYGAGNPTGPQPNDRPIFLSDANPSIVMVISSDNMGGPKFQGTGFFVNKKGDIITSYHIIDGHRNIQIRTKTKQLYRVKEIIAKDIFGDLARLAIDIPAEMVHPTTLNHTAPKYGEEIYVIGHPLGHPQTISYGRISSLFPVDKIGHLLQFSAPITRGSSGSPVFNLAGEVIGITSFMLFPGGNQPSLNYAIPTASLLTL
jgi:S1-C subfamily serine protease